MNGEQITVTIFTLLVLFFILHSAFCVPRSVFLRTPHLSSRTSRTSHCLSQSLAYHVVAGSEDGTPETALLRAPGFWILASALSLYHSYGYWENRDIRQKSIFFVTFQGLRLTDRIADGSFVNDVARRRDFRSWLKGLL